MSNLARQHFGHASWIVTLVGFTLGYAISGAFSKR
jgi:hypothetical protein